MERLNDLYNTGFQHSSIQNLSQLKEAFDFITSEIQRINEDLESGFDSMSGSRIFNEAIDYYKYDQTTQKIQKRLDEINAVTTPIQNYLSSGFVGGHPEIDIRPDECVIFVNGEAAEVKTRIEWYIKNKSHWNQL